MKISQILRFLDQHNADYEFSGDSEVEISQVAGLDSVSKGEISFLNDKKYLSYLDNSQASALILPLEYSADAVPAIINAANPYYVYALVAQCLNPFDALTSGVHDKAVVDASANIASTAEIQACAVIYEKVVIGENTLVAAGCVIEKEALIGENCRIGANVFIAKGCVIGNNTIIEAGAVIGGDGFGWANNKGEWIKIPQVGKVIVGNNVSIGNNVTIDRGAIKDTLIADNCIIDNQVHIAHNVEIGYGSAVAGQTGFAGSTVLGKHCTVAGQVGFAGHITITDQCHFLAKTGVTHDIKESGAYSGFPATKAAEWQKNSVRIRQLDKLAKQVKNLQKQIAELTEK